MAAIVVACWQSWVPPFASVEHLDQPILALSSKKALRSPRQRSCPVSWRVVARTACLPTSFLTLPFLNLGRGAEKVGRTMRMENRRGMVETTPPKASSTMTRALPLTRPNVQILRQPSQRHRGVTSLHRTASSGFAGASPASSLSLDRSSQHPFPRRRPNQCVPSPTTMPEPAESRAVREPADRAYCSPVLGRETRRTDGCAATPIDHRKCAGSAARCADVVHRSDLVCLASAVEPAGRWP